MKIRKDSRVLQNSHYFSIFVLKPHTLSSLHLSELLISFLSASGFLFVPLYVHGGILCPLALNYRLKW